MILTSRCRIYSVEFDFYLIKLFFCLTSVTYMARNTSIYKIVGYRHSCSTFLYGWTSCQSMQKATRPYSCWQSCAWPKSKLLNTQKIMFQKPNFPIHCSLVLLLEAAGDGFLSHNICHPKRPFTCWLTLWLKETWNGRIQQKKLKFIFPIKSVKIHHAI